MLGVLRLNEQLALITKQSLTRINVLLCLLLNIPLGLLYHKLLHPKRTPPVIRHLVGLVLGLWIGWICIGRGVNILIAITSLCYVLNYTIRPTEVHKIIFVVSFGIGIVVQTIRMIESYGENIFDYTGRLMVLIQKFTFVAFCFHDGVARDMKDLNDWQRAQCLKCITLHYTLKWFSLTGHDREPSPFNGLKKRILALIFSILGTALFGPTFPLTRNGDPTFIANTPFLSRFLYAWVSMFVARLKYYTAFLLGEMAVISCGMGFSGFDDNGNELWENASLINCYNVEFPTSLKMVVEGWNIATSKWLRRVVHDRVPSHKAAWTVTASVLWHGLYPGYFLIGTSCFLCHEFSKAVRRSYGHVYQDMSPIGQKGLSVLLIFVNSVLLTYCIIPFPLLRFDLGIQFWGSMYFFGHIVCGVGLVFLRLRRKPKPKSEDPSDLPKEAQIRNTVDFEFAKKTHLRKPHSVKES